jgi:hypothetical protein
VKKVVGGAPFTRKAFIAQLFQVDGTLRHEAKLWLLQIRATSPIKPKIARLTFKENLPQEQLTSLSAHFAWSLRSNS